MIMDMQIKTTMRYDLKITRMAVTTTATKNNICWSGCGEIGILVH